MRRLSEKGDVVPSFGKKALDASSKGEREKERRQRASPEKNGEDYRWLSGEPESLSPP